MSIPILNRLAARVAGKLSLQTVLIVPFVLQIAGTVGLVGYLSYRNGQKAVEDIAYQLMDEVDERVEQNLQHYLDVPKHINQSLAAAIRTRVLDWKNFSGLERYFAQQLQIYDTVSNVAIATEQKEFLAVEKSLTSDSLIIRVLDKSTDYVFHYYAANRQGKRIKLTKVRHDYNPHRDPPKGRPWYQAAHEAGQAIWLPVVNLSQGVDRPILTMVNFLPFDDPNGKFQGVLGTSLFLPQFASFLDSLKVGQTGQVFIIDRQGLLIASSTGETPFKPKLDSNPLKNLNPQDWRVVAHNSKNTLTQESVKFLLKHVIDLHQIEQKKQFEFDFHHNRYFLQVNPIQDKSKLRWLIITVVPEADFMKQIYANTRTTILLCIAALIGSTGIGILTARWITKPILRLNTAAKDIAKGQWDKPVEIERSDEVGELANSFNTMAAHLQQSFAELQSLNAALSQSESQLKQFLDALPIGVSIHEAMGKVMYFNSTAKRLLGTEIIPDAAPDELAQTYQLYRQNQLYPTEELPALRALKGETVFVDDIELHRDGEIIPGEVRSTPIFDEQGNIIYAITAFANITQRKQAEKLLADYNQALETQVADRTAELALAKELRETIYNESTDAIFLVNPKTLRITDCNRRAVELFEVTGKEDLIGIQGRTLQRHPYISEEIDAITTEMYQKGFWCREIEYVTSKGKVFWGNIAGKPVKIAGEAVNLIRITDISDRKLAEAALQASQARFAGILEIANDAIITVDAEQQITLFNQGAEKIFGYTALEILGQPIDLLLPAAVRTIHRQHVTAFAESVGKARRMGDRSEIFGRRKDGTEFPAEASISKLEINGEKFFTTILRDISERKIAEQEIRELTTALENAVEGISRLDVQGRYLSVNKAYANITGYQPEEMIGMEWQHTLHPEDCEKMIAAYQEMLEVGKMEAQARGIRKDGSIFYKQVVMITTRDEQNNFIGHYCFMKDITDRKLAEETLREREEQLQLALEGSGDGFWDWKIKAGELYLSPRYLEMLGYEVDELPQEFSTWDRLIHPEDKPWVMQTLHAHLADSSVHYNFDYRLLTKSREWKWIANYGKVVARDENGAPLRMTGTHRDVSDRKLAEEALRQSEATKRQILTAMPDLLIWIDQRGTQLEVFSGAGFKNFIEPSKAIGRNVYEFLPLEVANQRLYYIQQALQTGTLQIFEQQLTIDGKIHHEEVRVVAVAGDKVLAIIRDINERKQIELELQHAKEAAETANRAKSAFLANMSHELRTPLNGILGYAQILQRDKNATPKQKEGVDIIYQCGMHLLTLINDILDLSKIEAGKLELYPEDFNFPSFLTSLTEIFRLKAEQKFLTFTYLPLSELPRVIHADEKRLRQVLMNLLSNAVKFTDAGSVTFNVTVINHSSSVIGSKQKTNESELMTLQKMRFQVADTGIGITPEQLEKIFLPFEQVGHTSRHAEGTGLGLAITQKILELMGGKIVVESTPRVGSRFYFDLDVPVVSTSMKSTTVKSTDTIIGYSGSQRKILIVDDRWENRAVLVNILEPIGFEVEEAADGQEGLEKALEFQPDLILADLVMPVMDGYQMTRRLRQLPELHNTIIIAISANAFIVDRQQSLEAGCNDFLSKPIQSEDLLDKIKSYLNLSWIYEHESEAQSEELENGSGRYTQVALTQMVIPPSQELLSLYEAANTGYVQGVEQEVIRLQQFNPDYTPFATRILELAADFEYEEIANFIDRYLSEGSE